MSKRLSISKCPICSGAPRPEPMKVKDHSISQEVFLLAYCPACNFRYTQDPPVEDEIGSYYASEDYISHSDTKRGLINGLYHTARDLMLGKKRKMVRSVHQGKDLLDIGAGTGYFLDHMAKHGYHVHGVEVNEEAREFCKQEFGITCVPPSALFSTDQQQYDIITLWHVLEHLYDLDRYISRIRDLLKDNGVLIVAVPNHDSYDARHYENHWAAYDVPRHLYHFSPESMMNLIERYNMEIQDLKTLPLDAFYVSMLSEKYKGNPLFPVSGFLHGTISWLGSLTDVRKGSSVVYFIRKK